MKKRLLTISLLIIFHQANSQEKELLQNFQFRVKQFRAINISPVAALSNNNNKQPLGNNKNTGFNLYGTGNFTLLKSTDQLLQTLTIGLGSNYNSNRLKNFDGNRSGQKDAFVNPLINLNTRFYKNLQYLELGIETMATIGKSNIDQTNSGQLSTGVKKVNSYTIQPTIGVGMGRLENVTDMQNAIWLAKLLEKNNNLKRKLNKVEMNELARAITTSSNFRILDGRRRIQHILKETDKALTKNDLVSKVDINYFTTLNDIVFFANNFPRLHGKDIFIRFIPYLRSNDADFTQKSISVYNENEKLKNRNMQMQIGYKKYKSIDLKNQFNFGVIAKGFVGKENFTLLTQQSGTTITNINQITNWKEAALEHFIQYSFYPNTRTVLTAEIKGENGKYFNEVIKEAFYSNSLSVGGSYFVNFNTRLNFGLSLINQNSTNRFIQANAIKTKGTNLNCNLGVDFTF